MNWPLLLLAYCALFSFGLIDNARGPFYPLMLKEFSLSTAAGSWFFALSSLTGLFVTLLAKFWLPIKTTAFWNKIGLVLLGLGPLLLGLSSFNRTLPLLFLSSIIQGMGVGLCGMTMNLMVSQASPINHKRRAYGGLHSLYGVSSLLAPQLFSYWLGLGHSWSGFFFILSLAPFIVILVFSKQNFSFPSPPQKHKSLDFKNVSLSNKVLWPLMMGLYVASEIVVSSRLVLFLTQAKKLPLSLASLYLSGFFACLMLARILIASGLISLSARRAMAASLIGTGILLIMGQSGHYWALSLSGASMGVFFPVAFDYLASQFPLYFEKMTSLVMSSIGLILVLIHIGFGQFANALGVYWAFSMALALTLLALLSLIFLPSQTSSH
jgi:MFS transporter, FHS family, glucose/mannose:H+ symporter